MLHVDYETSVRCFAITKLGLECYFIRRYGTAGALSSIARQLTLCRGKIKAMVSFRAVEGRKCLSAHCFGWHCNGTAQNAPVPLQRKRCSESISRAPPIAA